MFVFILLHFPLNFLSANSVDPDQKPHLTVSELGLHMSPKLSGLKVVYVTYITILFKDSVIVSYRSRE